MRAPERQTEINSRISASMLARNRKRPQTDADKIAPLVARIVML
jgi:hypothetical protein